jgi:hypothetical protein
MKFAVLANQYAAGASKEVKGDMELPEECALKVD